METTKELKLQLEDLNNVIKGNSSNPIYIEVASVLKNHLAKNKLDPKEIVESLTKYKFDYFINETLTSITEKFDIEDKSSIVSNSITESIYDFKIANDIKTLRTTSIGKDPMLNGYLIKLEQYINENKGVPQYRYINEFINRVSPYKYDSEVKGVVEKLENYLKENNSKLLILDTIYNLRKQNFNGFYDKVLEKFENTIFKNDYSHSSILFETREFKDLSVVKTLVDSIAKLEGKEFKVWETKTNNIKVQNVICPAKIENNKPILFLEGKFLLVNKTKVTELNENKVIEKLPKFYAYCKNFESLGFTNTQSGLTKQLSNYITIDLKLDESNVLKSFINNSEVKNTKNLSEILLTESVNTRQQILSLFESIDKICALEDVKLINNTQTNSKIYIFKLEEKYNLFVKENKQIKLFESTGYQTYKYVNNKFKFDISTIFENEIKTAHNLIKKIEERKLEIIKSISIVEKSITKLDESIKLNSKDDNKITKLESLKLELENEAITLKENYIKLELESKEIASLKEEATNYTYEMGETVKLKDGSIGEIVSINDTTNEYGIYTNDNKFIVAKEDDIETSVSAEVDSNVKSQEDTELSSEENTDKSTNSDDLELDTVNIEINTDETIDTIETSENVEENSTTDTLDTSLEDDQSTETKPEPITATVTEDYGDFKAGDTVQIDPASYTSSGDEDLVAIVKKVETPIKTDEIPTETLEPHEKDIETVEPEPVEMTDDELETDVPAESPVSITIPKKFLKVEVTL